jgi:hypothetical protein
MTMQTESNTSTPEQQTGAPAQVDPQQAQQQGNQPGGEASQGTAQTDGQQQDGQQAEEQQQQQRDDKGRFKPPVQARIDELTRKRHEAEREAAYWKQQATGRAQSGQEPALQEPRPEQFEDYGQYTKALARYEAQQLFAQRDQEQSKTAQERAQQAEQQAQAVRAEAWAERQQAVKQVLPDYDTVMSAAANVHVSQAVQEALLDSDMGPQLAYHLAKNPALAQQLSGMSQRQVDREIGRLEASLSKPGAAQKAPPVSGAPKPGRPLGAGTSQNTDPSRMSMEEYRAYRAKQGARWAT